MTNEQIIEGNKLIDLFMEIERLPLKDWSWANTIKYHSSWDWLMPVVEKIESLRDNSYEVLMFENICRISEKGNYDGFKYEVERKSKLTATFEAVVEFIKWYNQNQQPTKPT